MRGQTPDLNDQLDRVEGLCPAFLAKPIHFLRAPGLRWLRFAAGALLIIGGLLSFLPILGIEMLPIGLMLIAIDVPFLRGPVAWMIDWIWRMVVAGITIWQAIAVRLRQTWRRAPDTPILRRPAASSSNKPADGATPPRP